MSVQFGPEMRVQSQALKTFLLHRLYRHPRVMHTTGQAKQVVLVSCLPSIWTVRRK